LRIDRSVKRGSTFNGGTFYAKKHLNYFLNNKLDEYEKLRNDPSLDYQSNMSPYLHFGQISPLYITLKLFDIESPGKEAYLEELIVRRELSMNYVFYNNYYDYFKGIPEWSKVTLMQHKRDRRDYIYSQSEMEEGETHDPYWNAAQQEMKITGKMHGYMRMYWGKKILEWSQTPEQAFTTALYLNNKYELDGRDPNSYTGIAWCFGKHDRPWKERAVYGKVRYMNDRGLRRKFDIDQYVHQINQLS
jgi:deoxyribodipyrimidine photo-lyase